MTPLVDLRKQCDETSERLAKDRDRLCDLRNAHLISDQSALEIEHQLDEVERLLKETLAAVNGLE